MRVLFVLPRMVSGGIEGVTLNLIVGFTEDGHDCALVSLDGVMIMCSLVKLMHRVRPA